MLDMDISQGHHVSDFDPIPAGGVGSSKDIPYTIAPMDFNTSGLPYGAWCRCSACGGIGRSTIAFDFYADDPGKALECERCHH